MIHVILVLLYKLGIQDMSMVKMDRKGMGKKQIRDRKESVMERDREGIGKGWVRAINNFFSK